MITTPEENEALIDLQNIKDQITLSEGELARLNKLRDAQEYTVAELVKEKKYNEDGVTRLKTAVEDLNDEIEKHEADLKDAREIISRAKTVKAQLDAERESIATNKENATAYFEARETIVSKKQASLGEAIRASHDAAINRTAELNEREAKIEAREARMASFVSEITRG